MSVRSGVNDPWVFRARKAGDLFGPHADLIGSALEPGERVEYMLYSPICSAEGGLFGIHGSAASHAVAVTEARLLVSADPMRQDGVASLEVIPLDSVLTVEIGVALALGWFVVRFVRPKRTASRVVFFRAAGMQHFRRVVRVWRTWAAAGSRGLRGLLWPAIWDETPRFLESEMRPLMLDGEEGLCLARSTEGWRERRRGRRAIRECVSSPGLLLWTDVGLVWGLSERPSKPGGLAFGVHVVCVPRDPLRASVVWDDGRNLRLTIEIDRRLRLDIPVDESWEAGVREIACSANRA